MPTHFSRFICSRWWNWWDARQRQIVYTHDRLLSSSFSNTQYFLNDSTIYDVEDEQAKQKQNRLVADFTLTSNGEKAYVANQLSADLAWNDVMMDIDGSYPNHQQVKMPKYKVSDKLELLHRSGKRTYTFNTYNAYMEIGRAHV